MNKKYQASVMKLYFPLFIISSFLIIPLESVSLNNDPFTSNIAYSAFLYLSNDQPSFKNSHIPSHLSMHDGLSQMAFEADLASGRGGASPYNPNYQQVQKINSVKEQLLYLQQKYPKANVNKIFENHMHATKSELAYCTQLMNNFTACFKSNGLCLKPKQALLSLVQLYNLKINCPEIYNLAKLYITHVKKILSENSGDIFLRASNLNKHDLKKIKKYTHGFSSYAHDWITMNESYPLFNWGISWHSSQDFHSYCLQATEHSLANGYYDQSEPNFQSNDQNSFLTSHEYHQVQQVIMINELCSAKKFQEAAQLLDSMCNNLEDKSKFAPYRLYQNYFFENYNMIGMPYKIASDNDPEVEQIVKNYHYPKSTIPIPHSENQRLTERMELHDDLAKQWQIKSANATMDRILYDIVGKIHAKRERNAEVPFDYDELIDFANSINASEYLQTIDAIAQEFDPTKISDSKQDHNFSLNDQMQTFIEIAHLRPDMYTEFSGNGIQKIIHEDLIKQIEAESILYYAFSSNDYCKDMIMNAAQCTDLCRQWNQANQVQPAMALSAFCWGFLKQIEYYGSQTVIGIGQGVCQGGASFIHTVTHPVEVIQGIAHLTLKTAQTLEDLCNIIIFPDEKDEILAKIKSDWQPLLDHLEHSFKNATWQDITREGTAFVVDLFLTGQSFKLLSKVTTLAKIESIKILQKTMSEQEAIAATEAGIIKNMPRQELMSLSKADEVIKQGSKVSKVAQIAQEELGNASNLGKKVCQTIETLIKNFDPMLYDNAIIAIDTLKEAVNEFAWVKGAIGKNGPLKQMLENAKFGANAVKSLKGQVFELETALKLKKAGEKIVSFGRIIYSVEFDIETATKLIECKNWNWNRFANNAQIGKLLNHFGRQKELAESVGLLFELHSKNNIPESIKKLILEKGIKIVEG